MNEMLSETESPFTTRSPSPEAPPDTSNMDLGDIGVCPALTIPPGSLADTFRLQFFEEMDESSSAHKASRTEDDTFIGLLGLLGEDSEPSSTAAAPSNAAADEDDGLLDSSFLDSTTFDSDGGGIKNVSSAEVEPLEELAPAAEEESGGSGLPSQYPSDPTTRLEGPPSPASSNNSWGAPHSDDYLDPEEAKNATETKQDGVIEREEEEQTQSVFLTDSSDDEEHVPYTFEDLARDTGQTMEEVLRMSEPPVDDPTFYSDHPYEYREGDDSVQQVGGEGHDAVQQVGEAGDDTVQQFGADNFFSTTVRVEDEATSQEDQAPPRSSSSLQAREEYKTRYPPPSYAGSKVIYREPEEGEVDLIDDLEEADALLLERRFQRHIISGNFELDADIYVEDKPEGFGERLFHELNILSASDDVMKKNERWYDERLESAQRAIDEGVMNWIDTEVTEANRFVPPPPSEARPNRKQALMPDLEKDSNDNLYVGSVGSRPSYAVNVESDPAIRLSSAKFKSLPRIEAMIVTAPYGYDKNAPLSKRTLWMLGNAMIQSVQEHTLKSYGLFFLRYLEWCEEEQIPVEDRFPGTSRTHLGFLAVMGHRYGNSYARQHLNGLVFVYRLHMLDFDLNSDIKRSLFRAFKNIRPSINKLKREVTLQDLSVFVYDKIEEYNNDENTWSHSVCVIAAVLLAFFGMLRLKDVTLPRMKPYQPRSIKENPDDAPPKKKAKKTLTRNDIVEVFDPKYDPSISSVEFKRSKDDENPRLIKFHLPFDKVKGTEGRDIFIVEQKYLGDYLNPVPWLQEQIKANGEDEDAFLFRYLERDEKTFRVLTRSHLIQEFNRSMEEHDHERAYGHGFRRGGATLLTLLGVDSEVIKTQGRWSSSDSYQRYQRQVEEQAIRFIANQTLPTNDDGESDVEIDPADICKTLPKKKSTKSSKK